MSTTKDAPAFDFYPERWLVGVAAMSDAEQLAYLRLLCHQWLMGDNGLPADLPALKRLAGKGVNDVVLAKIPVGEDGKRRNKRLEVVRQDQRKRISKSLDKIAKMNAARASTRSSTSPLQEPLVEGLQGPPHQSPITNHPVPEDTNSAGASNPQSPAKTPSLATVKAWADAMGCPADKAEIWWNEHESRPLSRFGHWTDRDGNAVQKPQNALAAWWQKWRSNDAQRQQRGLFANGSSKPQLISSL